MNPSDMNPARMPAWAAVLWFFYAMAWMVVTGVSKMLGPIGRRVVGVFLVMAGVGAFLVWTLLSMFGSWAIAFLVVAGIMAAIDAFGKNPPLCLAFGLLPAEIALGFFMVFAYPTAGAWPVLMFTPAMATGWVVWKIHRSAKKGVPRQTFGEYFRSSAWRTAAGGSAHNMRYPALPARYTFENVVGMDDLKRRLLAAGKEVVASLGKASNVRNGILLSGAPGNGKTLFAEALAGELGLPIIAVSIGDIASRWVNQSTEQMMQLFRVAAIQAPCVLFIDEVDSILGDRSRTGQYDNEGIKVTNAFLKACVDLRRQGVVLIAATNFLDMLDAAAIREGRFDFKIEVPPPDLPARVAIFSEAFLKEARRRDSKQPSIDQATVLQAVQRWDGFSAARINAIAIQAAGDMVEAKQTTTSVDRIRQALRTVQGRAGKSLAQAKSLEDLALAPTNKGQLDELADRLMHIEDIEAMGGSVPSGLLFWGPAGTGKTVTAQALAKKAQWAFLHTSGNDLLRSPEAIDKLLLEAGELRPCVVFIDEADDVLAGRSTSPYSASVTNKLLTALDGAGGRVQDVLFIAATNFPDQLDAAAMRGGRFTEKIEFTLPGEAQLAVVVTQWLHGLKVPADPALTVEAVTELLADISLADAQAILQAAVNQVASRRLRDQQHRLSLDDVRDGWDRVRI